MVIFELLDVKIKDIPFWLYLLTEKISFSNTCFYHVKQDLLLDLTGSNTASAPTLPFFCHGIAGCLRALQMKIIIKLKAMRHF